MSCREDAELLILNRIIRFALNWLLYENYFIFISLDLVLIFSQSRPQVSVLDVVSRPPDKSVYLKVFFLFPNQNICCGYS